MSAVTIHRPEHPLLAFQAELGYDGWLAGLAAAAGPGCRGGGGGGGGPGGAALPPGQLPATRRGVSVGTEAGLRAGLPQGARVRGGLHRTV